MASRKLRLGKFKVSPVFFKDAGYGNGANLFKDMIIFDVRREFASDIQEYVAYHPDFDKVAEGEIIPEYQAIFDETSPYPKWIKI